MTGILDDIKEIYNRPNNGLVKIIMINIAIFLLINIVVLFCSLFKISGLAETFYKMAFTMPADLTKLIFRPWTVITYFFAQKDLFHILSNMLFLYWFGRILESLIGNSKVISIYILGGLMGAAFYFLCYYTIPFFIDNRSLAKVLGASGSVCAIVVAAATLSPNYEIRLLLLGEVKIKWIAWIYVIMSIIGMGGTNAGGNAVHIGGSLLGFLFIRQLQKGDDWSRFVMPFLTRIGNLFAKKEIRVTHRSTTAYKEKPSTQKDFNTKSNHTNSYELDNILDKISQSGYESLTKEEKQKLWEASKRNNS